MRRAWPGRRRQRDAERAEEKAAGVRSSVRRELGRRRVGEVYMRVSAPPRGARAARPPSVTVSERSGARPERRARRQSDTSALLFM